MNFESYNFNIEQRRVAIGVFRHQDSTKTLIIGPAMGVRSSFYYSIAMHFHDQGFNCVLFDYHGMFFEKTAKSPSDIAAFGKTDLALVIDFALNVLRSDGLYFLGHSLSGQVLPLAENANAFKAAYLVASQSVDVANWSGKSRLIVSIFWNMLIPLTTTIFRYLPSWVYGGKHHLAKSVARDWARLAKSKGGIAEDSQDNKARYRGFTVPTKFISIDGDDLLAPRRAVTHLYHQYASSVKDLHHHSSQATAKGIDHFSFFRKHNSHLWEDITLWFEKAQTFRPQC